MDQGTPTSTSISAAGRAKGEPTSYSANGTRALYERDPEGYFSGRQSSTDRAELADAGEDYDYELDVQDRDAEGKHEAILSPSSVATPPAYESAGLARQPTLRHRVPSQHGPYQSLTAGALQTKDINQARVEGIDVSQLGNIVDGDAIDVQALSSAGADSEHSVELSSMDGHSQAEDSEQTP